MFQDPNYIDDEPTVSRHNVEHFDFVGPQEVRKKLISKRVEPLKLEAKNPQTAPE